MRKKLNAITVERLDIMRMIARTETMMKGERNVLIVPRITTSTTSVGCSLRMNMRHQNGTAYNFA